MAVLARTKASTWDSAHSPINLARARQVGQEKERRPAAFHRATPTWRLT